MKNNGQATILTPKEAREYKTPLPLSWKKQPGFCAEKENLWNATWKRYAKSGIATPHDMTIDANIAIAFLGGDTLVVPELSRWREEGRPFFLSTVVETEVLSFSRWSNQELQATEQFLEQNFTSIPFDRNLARIAAEIRREVKIKFPDAAIAATALFTHTPLVTRDQRDFKHIPNLRIISM